MKIKYVTSSGMVAALALGWTGCAGGEPTDFDDPSLGSVQQAGSIQLKCPDATQQPIAGTGNDSTTGIADLGSKLFATCDEAMASVNCDDADALPLLRGVEARAVARCEKDIKSTFTCAEPCRQEIDANSCKVAPGDSDYDSEASCHTIQISDDQTQYLGFCQLSAWANATGQSTGRCK